MQQETNAIGSPACQRFAELQMIEIKQAKRQVTSNLTSSAGFAVPVRARLPMSWHSFSASQLGMSAHILELAGFCIGVEPMKSYTGAKI
jgi:hypothetical protein